MTKKTKILGIFIFVFVLLLGLTFSANAEEENPPPSDVPTVERSVENPVPITAPLALPDELLSKDPSLDLITPKVIGGTPVSPQNKYPWMVSQQFYGSNFCGGTLIAPSWVLTAAHCWVAEIAAPPYYAIITPTAEKMVLGEYSISATSGHEQVITPSEVYIHPLFDGVDYLNYDIALIKLASPATLNDYVSTISLTDNSYNNTVLSGFPAVVSGWGYDGSIYPDILNEASVDFLSDADCSNYGGYYNPISMLCAGKLDGSRDTCYGDSGGPIFFNDGGTWKQAGITSWGDDCAKAGYPGVYARVSAGYDWIKRIIEPFNGGIEVSSDQPVVSIGRPHIGSEIAAYNGATAGSSLSYLPMLFNNKWGYTSTFTVQNTGGDTATYNLTFKDAANGSTSCTISGESLPQHGVKTYDITNLGPCDSGTLPDDWFGGATIDSDEPLAVIAKPDVNGTDAVTYSAFTGGADTAYLPMLFRGKWGYQSAFYVQNLDATPAELTIDFYDADGNFTCTYTDSAPLVSDATRGYWMGGIDNVNCSDGDGFDLVNGWAGSAVIETAGSTSIVAIGRPHLGAEVAAYNGFTTGSITNYLPMLFRGQWGYDAAIYIQNVSGSPSDIAIDFYDTEGNYTCTYTDPTQLQPNATRGYWTPGMACTSGGSFPTNGWAGSAKVTSTQNVIAVGRPHLSDGQVVVYNAFDSGSNNAYLPFNFRRTNNHGTAVYIQNLGTENANTQITLYDEEIGYICEMTKVIIPGAPEAIWLDHLTEEDCPTAP